MTSIRKDIAILLINQSIANRIRECVDSFQQILPAILEIPSKDSPYSEDADSMLKRVNQLFSAD